MNDRGAFGRLLPDRGLPDRIRGIETGFDLAQLDPIAVPLHHAITTPVKGDHSRRVGHAEGPQVNDPRAPEHACDVAAHFVWWRAIWLAQAQRGAAESWAEPEFGPPPYLQTLPHTCAPVADLWDVNKHVAARIREEFASVGAAPESTVALTAESTVAEGAP